MKHMFIVRHGMYSRDTGDLTEIGKKQIQRLADYMKAVTCEMCNGHYLLSSPAPRAVQSAEIIAQAFELSSFAQDNRLFPPEDHFLTSEELAEIDRMIESYKDTHDIITIMTHYEVTGRYPEYLAETLFGRSECVGRLEKGEGVHFDIGAKTCRIVRPR